MGMTWPPSRCNCGGKAGTGACGRFVEEIGQNFALQQLGAAETLNQDAHFVGDTEDASSEARSN